MLSTDNATHRSCCDSIARSKITIACALVGVATLALGIISMLGSLNILSGIGALARIPDYAQGGLLGLGILALVGCYCQRYCYRNERDKSATPLFNNVYLTFPVDHTPPHSLTDLALSSASSSSATHKSSN
jgi:hypothetical protein